MKEGTAMDFPITLTPEASEKAWNLLTTQGREDMRLRLQIQPGGCSGLVYQLFFDERTFDGDLIQQFGEVEVVVDKMSVPYLEGAVINYSDTIEKQGFDIDNPNATGTCACGDSFH
jgi:iron-sulfur cluster assembly accessory protein